MNDEMSVDMGTKSCPVCREEIKSGAIKCKHCGSTIVDLAQTLKPKASKNQGTLWLPIPSMVIGILCLLAMFDDSDWDSDTILGLFIMSVTSLTLGIISVNIQKAGKGMAIAGIVLASLSLLTLLGLLAE